MDDTGFKALEKALKEAGVVGRQSRQGKVAYWNKQRGFGFVNSEGKKYFLHIKGIVGRVDPQQGDTYSFKVNDDGKAMDAHRIDSEGT